MSVSASDDPDGPAADSDGDALGPADGPSGREVVVPGRLYKTVTVLSTLLAMVAVVGGFVVLDAATNRARAAAAEVDAPLALLGLGLIVGGALVYAYATRFRAAGVGDDGGTTATQGDEPDADGGSEPTTDASAARAGERSRGGGSEADKTDAG